MRTFKVLFIEDEAALAEIVKESLEAKGFDVQHTATISKATLCYHQWRPDIIVADVMLTDGNGFDWVASLRKSDMHTPVIFLTSRSQTDDVVKGFEQGGNDYLKKPFSIAELIVRMKALLKTGIITNDTESWEIGKHIFHYPAGELIAAGKKIQLTSREADLLHILLLNRNAPVTRNELLQKLWGNTDYFSGRSLDVFISKLRKYLSHDTTVKIINVRSIGYKLVY